MKITIFHEVDRIIHLIFMRKKLKLREVICLGLPVFPFPKNYLQVNLSDQAGSAYSSPYHIRTHQGQGTRSGWSLPRQPTPPAALHGRISPSLAPLGRPRAQGRTDYRLGAASLLSGIHLPRGRSGGHRPGLFLMVTASLMAFLLQSSVSSRAR